jgi:hypothetical protein
MADLMQYAPELNDEAYVEKITEAFELIEEFLNEIEAGRQGQASLAANFARYIRAAVGLQAVLQANGFKVTGAADGTAATDYVTLQQLTAAVFSPALPGQAGNARKVIRTDGTSASWGWPVMWDVVDADATALPGQALAVGTATASRLIALPASPAASTPQWFKDCDRNASVNRIRIDPGAESIEDGAPGEILEISSDGAWCCLAFIGGKWRVVA